MMSIDDYRTRRGERAAALRGLRVPSVELCERAAASLRTEAQLFVQRVEEPLRQVDPEDRLLPFLRSGLQDLEAELLERLELSRRDLVERRDRLLQDLRAQNLQDLFQVSDSVKSSSTRLEGRPTPEIYASLSREELVVLKFLEGHNDYRLLLQRGVEVNLTNKNELVRAFAVLTRLGDDALRAATSALAEKGVLEAGAFADVSSRLAEMRGVLTEALAEGRTVLDYLEIRDEEARKKVLSQCGQDELYSRVKVLEDALSTDSCAAILRANPGLFLQSRNDFDRYVAKLLEVRGPALTRETKEEILRSPERYSSLASLEALDGTAGARERQGRRAYNQHVARVIVEVLRSKRWIGNSYLPLRHLKDNVQRKLNDAREMEEFDETVHSMARARALIKHTKKGVTEAPISLNPHTSEIADEWLRETVKSVL